MPSTPEHPACGSCIRGEVETEFIFTARERFPGLLLVTGEEIDMRLDKYLKVSRLIRRRTVANEACDNGRVTLNGRVARASTEVKAGDVIVIAFGDREVKAEILSVQETVRKEDAAKMFRYL